MAASVDMLVFSLCASFLLFVILNRYATFKILSLVQFFIYFLRKKWMNRSIQVINEQSDNF